MNKKLLTFISIAALSVASSLLGDDALVVSGGAGAEVAILGMGSEIETIQPRWDIEIKGYPTLRLKKAATQAKVLKGMIKKSEEQKAANYFVNLLEKNLEVGLEALSSADMEDTRYKIIDQLANSDRFAWFFQTLLSKNPDTAISSWGFHSGKHNDEYPFSNNVGDQDAATALAGTYTANKDLRITRGALAQQYLRFYLHYGITTTEKVDWTYDTYTNKVNQEELDRRAKHVARLFETLEEGNEETVLSDAERKTLLYGNKFTKYLARHHYLKENGNDVEVNKYCNINGRYEEYGARHRNYNEDDCKNKKPEMVRRRINPYKNENPEDSIPKYTHPSEIPIEIIATFIPDLKEPSDVYRLLEMEHNKRGERSLLKLVDALSCKRTMGELIDVLPDDMLDLIAEECIDEDGEIISDLFGFDCAAATGSNTLALGDGS